MPRHTAIRKLRVLVAGLAASLVVLTSAGARAYELDTHFYDTYAMAREAGFKHEYARFLALGSQWVDKGVSSTPMGGPVLGTMLRRIWHFPGYRYKTAVGTHERGKFKWKSIATFNHPVAHKLFDEGIRQSNWMKVALSLHIVQDSAGHAGFSDALGHLEFGHNPDRPWAAPEKYKRMTGLIFKQLVALRQVAPKEALEPWALQKRAKPVTDRDHRELQESYWKKMEPLIRRNYFKDPRYTPRVVNSILRDAMKNGYIRENAGFKLERNLPREKDYLLPRAKSGKNDPSLRGRKDARKVLKEWVTRQREAEVSKGILVNGSVFNLKTLDAAGYKDIRLALEKVEKQERDPAKRIQRYREIVSPEITRDVISWTVDNLTRGHIPQKFGPYVHVQFESESGPRQIEKQLKQADRRAHIKRLYGVDLKFGKKDDYFTRKDRISAIFVKWGHNLRTIARDFSRRGVSAHGRVKGYQSASVLNDKVGSGAYPQMGKLEKRSLTGRSRVRAKRVGPVRR
jgi:hypothetical protein